MKRHEGYAHRVNRMADLTLEQASLHLTSTDPRFAVEEATIRGVRLPVFTNAPATLRDFQAQSAALQQNPDYIVYEGERTSYADYMAQSDRISRILTERFGIKKGDRVAIAMRNYPEYLTLFMGIVNIGAVAVLVNAWWTTDELTYGFDDSGAKLVFADGPRFERIAPFAADKGITMVMVRDAAPHGVTTLESLMADTPDAPRPTTTIDTDDDFGLLYSSGSTGHPKGVVLTHRGAMTAVTTWLMSLQLPPLMMPADTEFPAPQPQGMLCATPLFHVTASHPTYLLSMAIGAKLVLMRKWDAEQALAIINEEKITRFLGVPTMSADLREAAVRLGVTVPSLTYLGSGGAKRPAAQVAEQADAFPSAAVSSGWGMTETNAVGIGIAGPDYVDRPENAGRLLPPVQQLRIVDDHGHEVPTGEIGEIAVKSAANMRCYLNKPEATAEAVKDGWLYTGDLARIDAEGYVTIVDRKKNIIIRGGENISCLEVEGAIHRHPAVAEAVVFPAPDERLGEIVGAGVQLKPDARLTTAELTSFLNDHLAGFKHPAMVWWTFDQLPRGATDKTDRRVLKTTCLAGRMGAPDSI